MRVSTNITRRLVGGPGARTTEGQFTQMASQAEAPVLQRGVVVDVVTDTSLLSDDYLSQVANIVDNPELIDVMPVGSVIARMVSNQGGMGATSNTVLFPFWSSHLMLPVQPGEQIYAIYEDYTVSGTRVGYWLSRAHGFGTFEDPNYTHHDRRFDPSINPGNYTTSDVTNRPTTLISASFQNGGNTPDTLTLVPSGNLNENPYDTIWNSSRASKYVTPEPVPRWKKRPQEFVLQGSNNAIIVLGEDRNGPISGSIQPTPVDIVKFGGAPRQAGSIDLIVGRGRYLPEPGVNPREVNDSNPPGENNTAPIVTVNSRGYRESDKNPFRTQRVGNPIEGDPSPIYDAARLYVVQQSKVDENYGLVQVADKGLLYPENAIPNIQPAGTGPYGRSYVVAKADNIRVIARREPQAGARENIAGTILLVREGNRNTSARGSVPGSAAERNNAAVPDGNMAYMLFDQTGAIQADARKIVLGRGNDNKEPYIRWTYYNVHMEELKTQVKLLADHVKKITDDYNTAFTSAIAVPWSSIAQLVVVGPRVSSETSIKVEQIKQKIDTINQADAKSKKIFGE